MKMTMKHTLILALTLGLALPAWAGRHDDDDDEGTRPIKETRALRADAKVSVSNVQGLIDVEAWDRKELQLTGELAAEVEKLEITGNESAIKIEVKLPKRVDHAGDTVLRLKIPAGASLDADGVSADVRVRGLKGEVEAQTVSGDVRINVESTRVRASSVSGDVTVDAPTTELRVESVSGDVNVRGARGGEVRGESVSGDVNVVAKDVKRLELETVSGDLDAQVDLAKDAQVDVQTLSGCIVLALPGLPDGDIDMETFSGELQSSWKLESRDDEDKEWRRSGTGRGSVKLHSFSGDIELRKR